MLFDLVFPSPRYPGQPQNHTRRCATIEELWMVHSGLRAEVCFKRRNRGMFSRKQYVLGIGKSLHIGSRFPFQVIVILVGYRISIQVCPLGGPEAMEWCG